MRKPCTADEPFIVSVPGEPASKSNSRTIARIKGISRIIKSAKALAYVADFSLLCRTRGGNIPDLFEGDVVVGMKIYYRTRLPDLNEDLVLDCLQGRAYANDRQVKTRITDHGLDKDHPRVEIFVAPRDRTPEAVAYILSLD